LETIVYIMDFADIILIEIFAKEQYFYCYKTYSLTIDIFNKNQYRKFETAI